MDTTIALVNLATNIRDNREEVMSILNDYITLRYEMLKRINDENLGSILSNLDKRYKEVLDELDNEYSILCSISSYIANYIGYDKETGKFLYDYAQNIIDCVDNRAMYSTFLYKWYLDILKSPLKTTKEYEFPKYEEQITRSDVIRVMLLQKI